MESVVGSSPGSIWYIGPSDRWTFRVRIVWTIALRHRFDLLFGKSPASFSSIFSSRDPSTRSRPISRDLGGDVNVFDPSCCWAPLSWLGQRSMSIVDIGVLAICLVVAPDMAHICWSNIIACKAIRLMRLHCMF